MLVVGFGLAGFILVLLVIGLILSRARARQIAETPPMPARDRKRARWTRPPRHRYDWEPLTGQLYRTWKNVPGPAEDREAIRAMNPSPPLPAPSSPPATQTLPSATTSPPPPIFHPGTPGSGIVATISSIAGVDAKERAISRILRIDAHPDATAP